MPARRPADKRKYASSDSPSWTAIFDGPAGKLLFCIAGIVVGVLATHADLGRRVETMTMRVEQLTERINAVERSLERNGPNKK